ncbi:MAG TPA: hypothetical protein ENK94_00995 [Campylobacterales bacterium]|nr:hypothetical protein [Campylobacterales bacterium]
MKTRFIIKLATLSILTFSSAYAGICDEAEEIPAVTYKNMTTAELQEAVEKLSAEDRLPFEMGLELIKRWTTEERVQ